MADKGLLALQWGGDEWVAGVAIPYFRGCGGDFLDPRRDEILRPWGGADSNAASEAYQRVGEVSEDPFDYDALFRDGKFRLTVDTGGRKRQPAKGQLRAWEKIVARGEAVWDELMAAVLADYRAQRPVRVRWWKVVYGDLPYHLDLPEVEDVQALRRVVRPYGVRVHPVHPGHEMASVTVHLMGTWTGEGFGVRIVDGRVTEIVPGSRAYADVPKRVLDVPGLGRLERGLVRGESWAGLTACEPTMDFQDVLEQRTKFRTLGRDRERPRSLHSWDYVRRRFAVYFYVRGEDAVPSDAQVAAFLEFKRDETAHLRTILDAVLADYRESIDRYRLEVELPLPDVSTVDGLREMLELRHFYVQPADAEGKVRIVLEFGCAWGDREFMVFWRDGRVERFGKWKDRLPPGW